LVELVGALAGVYVTVLVIGVLPFRNCTVPDGGRPMLLVVTVAVRVTLVPDVTLDWLEVTVVVVGAGVTVIVVVADVLAL
jgi:hypothetical protein